MATRFYRIFLKRVLDLILAVSGLLLLSPVLIVVCVWLLLAQGRPLLFTQTRPGKDEKLFDMVKFRTMKDTRDEQGRLLPDAQRITAIGAFLRRTSLDELPELWNVARGQMSLVGPRPLLVEYLSRYSPHHRRRHEVRPGITGLAQVSGRQNILFSKRMEHDVWYVDHHSLLLDLKILLLTVVRVFGKRDVVIGQEVVDVDDLGLSAGLDNPATENKS